MRAWTEEHISYLGLGLALAQTGCLDSLLEAPLILATGMGEVHGLAPTPRDSLLVATEQGLVEVNADGSREPLTLGPADDVSTLPEYIVLLSGGVLSWGPYPEPGEPLELLARLPAPDVTRIQAWYHTNVLLGGPEGITQLDLLTYRQEVFSEMNEEILELGLGGGSQESGVVALSASGLHRVKNGQSSHVVLPIPLHGAEVDHSGRLWYVHGTEATLSIETGSRRKTLARGLGDPRAMTMGSSKLMPSDAIYIATADGNIEYIRAPFP